MSRCFPFPPPGYEKKPTTDDPDLLKKEKRREKKHKKDKKDKDRKDRKEKKEKDRSEKKHKEKKDKHRDKKKDKEKSETSTPDETNLYGPSKGCNGERLHHNNEHKNFTDWKKPSIQFPYQNGDLLRNKINVGDAENYKFVQESGGRIRDEDKGTGSHQFVVDNRKNNVNKVEMRKTVARQVVMDVAGFSGNVSVPNRINGATPLHLDIKRIEKMQEKVSDDKRGDKRKNGDQDKQKQGKDKEMEQEKRMEKLKEKSEQMKVERAKNKHIMMNDLVAVANTSSTHLLDNGFLGAGNEGNLKKRKDMETNGVSHENELRPNKMARPVSNFSPENGRKLDFSQTPGPTLLDKQGAYHGGNKGGQRVNGMITSQPVSLPAKRPPIPAAHSIPSKPSLIKSPPVITNHVASQAPPVSKTMPPVSNHIAAQLSTPKPPPSIPNPITLHHQLPPLSSPSPMTTGKQQRISRPKPPPAPLPIPKKKAPHPDTKYLNQILSVPKSDQWCGLDDQEWLFSSKAAGPTSKKPPTDDLEVQVWSEAKHIESVDICALPYVIPY